MPELPGVDLTAPPPVLVKLLDHPKRRAILRRVLTEGASPSSPTELSKALGFRLSDTAYHVRVLAGDDALILDHFTEGRGSREGFYVPGPLVKAFPDFVAAALAINDRPGR